MAIRLENGGAATHRNTSLRDWLRITKRCFALAGESPPDEEKIELYYWLGRTPQQATNAIIESRN